VGDGNILQGDVKFGGAEGQIVADTLGDSLTLGDQLGGVKLGDDGLEDFVADGGQDSLVVVDTEVLESSLGLFSPTERRARVLKGLPGRS
jgi:hypothetical protein